MNIFEKFRITKEKFEEKERKVLEHMVRVYTDVIDVEKLLREENYQKFMEDIMILVFVLADSMSRFFEIMENAGDKDKKKLKSRERFTKWIDTFVLKEENNAYKGRKRDINCNSDIVWKLRCSLVHFYGLPDLSDRNEQTMLLNGPWNNKKGREMVQFFKKKGINLKIIDIDGLELAILKSLALWQKYLLKTLKEEPEKYIAGILELLEVTEKECSVKIDMKTVQKI